MTYEGIDRWDLGGGEIAPTNTASAEDAPTPVEDPMMFEG